MHREMLALAAAVLVSIPPLSPPAPAFADPPAETFRYPRVYGPTGRPYGPTQAHYQYERQYGRPWHGQGGLTADYVPVQHFQGHVPYGYLTYGHYAVPGHGFFAGVVAAPHVGFGPVYGYTPPVVIAPQPFYGPNLFDNPVLNHAREENHVRWNLPLAVEPVDKAPPRYLQPSSVEAKLRSLRSQAHGDAWFRKTDFMQAYLRYKQAVDHARDRSEPYFRLAMAYTGLGRYSLAVRELKRGLRLDPSWPSTGISLDELFGEDNRLAKSAVMGGAVAWAREDIRDPDRLFLLGVLLHFDDDERSEEFFQAAYRLAGGGQHLAAFLNPVEVQPAGGADPVLPPGEPLPEDDGPLMPEREAPPPERRVDDLPFPPAPEPQPDGR